MKKRTKKHNPLKRYINQSRIALKDACIAFSTGGDGQCRFYNFKNGNEILANKSLVDACNNIQHKWTYVLAAFERDSNGKEKIKSEEYAFNTPLYRNDLLAVLNEKHREFISTMRQELLVGCGWVAIPSQVDNIDGSILDRIFTELGAFNLLSAKQELSDR